MVDPDNLVLTILREMRAEMADFRGEIAGMRAVMATKNDLAEVRSEIQSLRADVASDMISLEKRLSEQVVGLRRAVVEYHSSVIGHGIMISDLEARVRRVEQHLNLDSVSPL